MQRLMKQVSEAARSVRMLAEDIDRHPESLLRGRSENGGGK
jgi:paraquat-inducible protein B